MLRREALLALSLLAVLSSSAGCKRRHPPTPLTEETPQDAGPKVATARDARGLRMLCGGETVATDAPAYAKTPSVASPILTMFKTEGGKYFDVVRPNELRGWSTGDGEKAQLLACVEIVNATKARECTFSSSKAVLELYSSTTRIRILEAKTGKTLVDKNVSHTAGGCPSTAWTSGDRTKDYGEYGIEVAKAAAEFQPADAPPPQMPPWTMTEACEGKPAVGAAKLATAKGSFNKFAVFRREGEGAFGFVNNLDVDLGKSEWTMKNIGEGQTSAVVCMSATRGKSTATCPFSAGKKLKVTDATWKVDLVEAATGKTLHSKTVKASAHCPSTWNFANGDESLGWPDLAAWMAPVIEPTK